MIIDVNAFIGKWPYWPVRASTAGEVLNELHGWGIDRAAVCSTRSLFVNWEDGNREAEEAARAHPESLCAFACLGPLELSHTLARIDYDFDDYAARGFRGIRLYPQHHSYHLLFEPFVERICVEAAARQWPVLLPLRTIMNWGMPAIDPSWMAALVERYPGTTWILAGVNYLHELRIAVSLLKRFSNVHLETSCVMGFAAIAKLVGDCGSEQILFGSGAPLQQGRAAVEKVAHAEISDAAREAIFSGNALRLLQRDFRR